MSKKKSITKGTLIGGLGFLIPQIIFLYTGSSNYTIWIMPAFLYVFGFFEYPTLFGTESDLGIDIVDFNWFLNPSEITTTINFLTDVNFYIQAFETFLYGGSYGSSSIHISGILFVISGSLATIALVVSLGIKNSKISGILFIFAGVLTIIALLLTWQNATTQTWIGGFIDSNFLPLPVGSLVLLVGGFFNLRE